MTRKGTIGLDFDGPVHRYSKGWLDGSIYDEPTPGALEAVNELMLDYAIFIHTAREPIQVVPWLNRYGFKTALHTPAFWNEQGTLLVTNKKLPAMAYIDDRGIRWENWDQTLADIEALVR
jgi:hypothetical protein